MRKYGYILELTKDLISELETVNDWQFVDEIIAIVSDCDYDRLEEAKEMYLKD